MIFDKLVWKKDRVLLDDLVFRLELEKQRGQDLPPWELGDACFQLYKYKWLLDDYARFLNTRPNFSPQNLFEIGIFDGGSTVLWFEHFQPKKLVAIDLCRPKTNGTPSPSIGDSEYFKRYASSRGLERRIKTYWGIDQGDRAKLREMVAQEFDGPLDLVLDDGSHLYGPTRASFETLFPLLRPGGLYVIEDWSWSHWQSWETKDFWPTEPALTKLITELVEVTGSSKRFMSFTDSLSLATSRSAIADLTVYQEFVVVERGDVSAEELSDFAINKFLSRRRQDAGYGFSEAGCEQDLNARCVDLQNRCTELQTRYDLLYRQHVPLTYLSGLLRATGRAALRKLVRTLTWSQPKA